MLFFNCKIRKMENFIKKVKKGLKPDSDEWKDFSTLCEATAEKVISHHYGLKLIIISDTHGELALGNGFDEFISGVEEYDLCIILGDIYSYELEKILEYILPERIIALRGNHDSFDVYDKFGIRNINGKVVNYNGIRFAGIEGSFKYKNGEFPAYTQEESLIISSSMPEKADIMLSHDCMFEKEQYDKAHQGLAGITHYVYKNGVRWHIHGHIHKSYKKCYSNGTLEKSVYGCEYLEV